MDRIRESLKKYTNLYIFIFYKLLLENIKYKNTSEYIHLGPKEVEELHVKYDIYSAIRVYRTQILKLQSKMNCSGFNNKNRHKKQLM